MDFSKLNENQLRAVRAPADRPVKISAGAGTGKTTVLTARFLELIRRGFRMESILALTFTRKAAAEMRTRIFQSLADPRDILKAHIYNFDSFFLSILTANTLESGVDRSVRIIQNDEINKVLREAFNRAQLKVDSPPISPGRMERYLSKAFAAVGEARLNLIDEETFMNEIAPHKSNPRGFGELAAMVYREYNQELEKIAALDFPAISLKCYRLLRDNKSLRNELNQRYRYILLDEVQDTNPAQFKLLSLIADKGMKNVTAVGDDKQSIYGFRGAEIDNLRGFAGEEHALSVNYRSPESILNLAHKIICQDEYFSRRAEQIRLKSNRLETGVTVQVHLAPDIPTEADFVAAETAELISKGMKPSNTAILSRTKAPLKAFESSLSRLGIPHCTIGGGYFEREEIKDILALIKIAAQPDDCTDSLARLKFRKLCVGSAHNFLMEKGGEPEALPVTEAIVEILKSSGYMRLAAEGDYPEKAAANIDKLLEIAEEFASEDRSRSLNEFVETLESNIMEGREEIEAEYTGAEAVSLMTIHQAKGLEWDMVFVVQFNKSGRTVKPDFVFDRQTGELTLRYDPITGDEINEYSDKLSQSGCMSKAEAEEIRLRYVAVTRARDKIYLTGLEKYGIPEFLTDFGSGAADDADFIRRFDETRQIKAFTTGVSFDRLEYLKKQLKRMRDMPPPAPETVIELNFTALRDFLHCPRYYYYRHELKLTEPEYSPDKEKPGYTFGVLIGDIFHRIVAADPHLEREWGETLANVSSTDETSNLPSYFPEEMDRLIENYTKLGLHQTRVFWVEKGFSILLERGDLTVRFKGVIDRLEAVEGKKRMLDFKTGSIEGRERLDEYSLQLSCYGLAARQGAVGEKFSPLLAVAAVKEGKIIETALQPEAETVILNSAVDIARGDFLPNKGKVCDWCPYEYLCSRDDSINP